MRRVEREEGPERAAELEPQRAAPAPVPAATLLRAGVGNHALSRWILQREPQTYEDAAAELRGIETGPPVVEPPEFADELLAAAPANPMAAVNALDAHRARVESRHLEQAQREGHAERRAADATRREGLEARSGAARTALTAAQTAAVKVLADCKSLIETHTAKPAWTEYEAGAKDVLDAAKTEADTQAAALGGVKASVKTALDGLGSALGADRLESAVKTAEETAADIAAKAAAAADAVREHKEKVDAYVAAANIPIGSAREAVRQAAIDLGLPADMAGRIIAKNISASKKHVEHLLTTTREQYQSVAGPTLVTKVLGLGSSSASAATCGIDNVGSIAGKRVHLTLFWDQVSTDQINLNQSDDAILDKLLGTGDWTCMHVTAEVYGVANPTNPSAYWKGKTKHVKASATVLAIKEDELETQLTGICAAQVSGFKKSLADKRKELGARVPKAAAT